MRKKLFVECIIIIIETFSVLMFFKNTIFLSFILFSLSLFCFALLYNIKDAVSYIVAAIIGSLGEIVAVYRGAWIYTKSDFLNIPIWLPLAWGITVVEVRRVSELLIDVFKKTDKGNLRRD